MRRITQTLCLSVIGLLLIGYVLADRGFAHLGVPEGYGLPPIYVGEITLAISILLFLAAPDIRILLESRTAWLIIAFCLWCFAQTAPYIGEYGLDALRDATFYGYSIFAFIVAACLTDPPVVRALVAAFDRASTLCVVLLPVMIALMPVYDPVIDGTNVPFIMLKAGDTAVHLAGAASFRLLGLRNVAREERGKTHRLPDWLFWGCWFATFLWVISSSRGAMMALGGAFAVIVVFGFGRRFVAALVAAAAVALVTVAVLDIHIEQDRREISAAQIIANATSIFSSNRDAESMAQVDVVELESTAAWRLNWWQDIIAYTVFGDYFWSGQGFGINLADADGYQADVNGVLRSPHNAHLTILARAGVPGLLLWLSFLAAFSGALILRAVKLRRHRADFWQRLNLWILAYWTASIVNGTFDVYLEGPQGGIWHWVIVGVGMGILCIEGRLQSVDGRSGTGRVSARQTAS